MKISAKKVEFWQTELNHLNNDAQAIAEFDELTAIRQRTLPEIRSLISHFVSSDINIETFRKTFDSKTREDWVEFGLGGFSGGMLLNQLVKNIKDTKYVTEQLRVLLKQPSSLEDGQHKLKTFQKYLIGIVKSDQVSYTNLQYKRLPFFVSGCWQAYDPELWPPPYLSGRQSLEQQNMLLWISDPTDYYFSFRETFLELKHQLKIPAWLLEYLFIWFQKQQLLPKTPKVVQEPAKVQVVQDVKEEITHTQVQMILAKIGQNFGYKIWIASNDHNRTWHNERLGDFSIKELTAFNGVGARTQRMIELIDVVWLKGQKIEAAFEIEKTTSIYSGLLRLADLTSASENTVFPLYIVAPQTRLDDVRAELSRTTFQSIKLHKRCKFFSTEKLIESADSILEWSSDISVIDRKLAQSVEDEIVED